MGTEITTIPKRTQVISTTYALFPTTGLNVGDLAFATDTGILYRWNGTAWSAITTYSPIKMVRKSADEIINNSTTLQNDDDLLVAMGASEVWHLFLSLRFIASVAAARSMKVAFTVPAAASFVWHVLGDVATVADEYTGLRTPRTTVAWTPTVLGNESPIFFIWGVYIGGANAGNLQLQWAQNTAYVEDHKLLANSYLIASRVG